VKAIPIDRGMANMPAPAEVPECPVRNAIQAISTIPLALLPARISNSMRRVGVISDRGWSREFDDPIVLPEGEKLRALRDAANYITELPEKESAQPGWQAAIEALMLVADRSDRRDEGSKRRARVRSVTEGSSLGPPQTRARSMKQESVGVAA
jgi:hypothetical protein